MKRMQQVIEQFKYDYSVTFLDDNKNEQTMKFVNSIIDTNDSELFVLTPSGKTTLAIFSEGSWLRVIGERSR